MNAEKVSRSPVYFYAYARICGARHNQLHALGVYNSLYLAVHFVVGKATKASQK
jgi:hypothetical protein